MSQLVPEDDLPDSLRRPASGLVPDEDLPDNIRKALPKRGMLGALDDWRREGANAIGSTMAAVGDFIKPGNEFSATLKDQAKEREAGMSREARLAKQEFNQDLEQASGIGDEIVAVGKQLIRAPGMLAAQAAGSLIPSAGAIMLGGIPAAAAMGMAGAGGDAAGNAYELVMKIPLSKLQESPEYQARARTGMSPDEIREDLATLSARQGSIVPGLVGLAAGATGVEKLLGKGAGKGVSRLGAAKTGAITEGASEAVEEGVTAYSGAKAAQQFDESIDASKGVAAAAAMGGVLGAGTGGVVGLAKGGVPADPPPPPSPEVEYERSVAALESAVDKLRGPDPLEIATTVQTAATVDDAIKAAATLADPEPFTEAETEALETERARLATPGPLRAAQEKIKVDAPTNMTDVQTDAAMASLQAPRPLDPVTEAQRAVQTQPATSQVDVQNAQLQAALGRVPAPGPLQQAQSAVQTQPPTSMADVQSMQVQSALGKPRQPGPLEQVQSQIQTNPMTGPADAQATATQAQQAAQAQQSAQLQEASALETANNQLATLNMKERTRAVDQLVSAYSKDATGEQTVTRVAEQMKTLNLPPLTPAEIVRISNTVDSASTLKDAPAAPDGTPLIPDTQADNSAMERVIKLKASAAQANPALATPYKHSDSRMVDATALPKVRPPAGQPGSLTQTDARMLTAIGKAFGRKVQLFESDRTDAHDGYVIDGDTSTVFINKNSQVAHMVVLGHELLHQVKMSDPDVYQAISDVVKLRTNQPINPQLIPEGDNVQEEITADLVGNLFKDPTFWRDTFSKMQNERAQGLGDVFAKVVDKFRAVIGSIRGYATGQIVADLDKVKAAATEGLARYLDRDITRAEDQRAYAQERQAALDEVVNRTPQDQAALKDEWLTAMDEAKVKKRETKTLDKTIEDPGFQDRVRAQAQADRENQVTTELDRVRQQARRRIESRRQTRTEGEVAAQQPAARQATDAAQEVATEITPSVKRKTETPEFRRWFGDSKVVDADGNPLVVYHGTNAGDFAEFNVDGNWGDEVGAFFTTDPTEAGSYGSESGANVKPVYLAINDPYIVTDRQWAAGEGLSPREARDSGRDGYVIEHRNGARHFVAFRPEQIKSAIGNSGEFDPANPDITASARRNPFYSALTKQINGLSANVAPANGWRDAIKGLVNKGLVKQDEVEWSGINEWLGLQQGKVTKQQVVDYLDANGVRVEETVLSQGGVPNNDEWEPDDGRVGNTRYGNWQLPGGTNYREVLLTLPTPEPSFAVDNFIDKMVEKYGVEALYDVEGLGRSLKADFPSMLSPADQRAFADAQEEAERKDPPQYKSAHWDQPNILAHIRLNDRIDADGARVLFVEEVQSDWGQEGKKKGFGNAEGLKPGYSVVQLENGRWQLNQEGRAAPVMRNDTREGLMFRAREAGSASTSPGVPRAPFVENTDKWLTLALKRIVKMAVDEDYDKVAFVTGQQSADRYDLSKQVDRIDAKRRAGANDLWDLDISTSNGQDMRRDGLTASDLEDNVGKEMAKKIIDATTEPGKRVRFSGLDLKVGGEGMKAFYDQIVPSALKKLLPKVGGGQVDSVGIPLPKDRANNAFVEAQYPGFKVQLGRSGYLQEDGTPGPKASAKLFASMKDAESALAVDDTSQQPGFVVTDAMREKAADGLPIASARRQIFDDSGRDYTPEQLRAMENVGHSQIQRSAKERGQQFADWLKGAALQGLFDQFRPIQEISKKAYQLARLSRGAAAGGVETLLKHGKLRLDASGVMDGDQTGGVVDRLFVPLGKESTDFLRWLGAKRAEQLRKVGKENLHTEDDIAALKTLASGDFGRDFVLQHGPRRGEITRDRAEVYADSAITFKEFGDNVLSIAEQSGMMTPGLRQAMESDFYVPFYRVVEDGNFHTATSGLSRQKAFKMLKGGTGKLEADLINNVLMNWAGILESSAKNRAALETVQALEAMGAAIPADETTARQMGKSMAKGNHIVWVMDQGEQRYFVVEDPLMLIALTSLGNTMSSNAFIKAASAAKNVFTRAVTMSPAFKLRNLVRDTVSAAATSPELSLNLMQNLRDGFKSASKQDQRYISALASGGLIRFGASFEGNQSKQIRMAANVATDEASFKGVLLKGWNTYEELGNISEEVNRIALFKQALENSGNLREAAFEARDLMDFSSVGSFAIMRDLSAIVPFFNARVQGLYRLGRSDPKRLATVILACAIMGAALDEMFEDDEDYQKREDWDVNGYWWAKIGGVVVRIPKPFEVGSAASVISNTWRLASDDNYDAKQFFTQFRKMLSDTLSFDPTPQLIKPIWDLSMNKDRFTERDIESVSMQNLRKQDRYNINTSMTARGLSTANAALSKATGGMIGTLSPVQYDFLAKSYFGWAGATALITADYALRPVAGARSNPDVDMLKRWSLGFFSDADQQQSRYLTQVYDEAKKYGEVVASYKNMLKTAAGDPGKLRDAAEFRRDNAEDMAKAKRAEAAKKRLTDIQSTIRAVERNDRLTDDQKRARMDELQARQQKIALDYARRLPPPGALSVR